MLALLPVAGLIVGWVYQRSGRDSGNFRKTDNNPLRLQGKFDVFGHGALVPIQIEGVMA
jgi:hypothetical protein